MKLLKLVIPLIWFSLQLFKVGGYIFNISFLEFSDAEINPEAKKCFSLEMFYFEVGSVLF